LTSAAGGPAQLKAQATPTTTTPTNQTQNNNKMGIEGFWSYIIKSGLHELFVEQVNCKGATLLIDGSNYMFHLMKLIIENGTEPIDRRFGGSFAEFRAIIRREVNQLLQLGFKITVYFDGHASDFKKKAGASPPANKFVERWKDEWANLHDVITYHVKVIDQGNLPLAPLTRHFFELVLVQDFADTVKLVKCDREADIIIAQDCKRLIAAGKKASFIYSDDRYDLVEPFVVFTDSLIIRFVLFYHPILTATLPSCVGVHWSSLARLAAAVSAPPALMRSASWRSGAVARSATSWASPRRSWWISPYSSAATSHEPSSAIALILAWWLMAKRCRTTRSSWTRR
jgi:hypothetical protein